MANAEVLKQIYELKWNISSRVQSSEIKSNFLIIYSLVGLKLTLKNETKVILNMFPTVNPTEKGLFRFSNKLINW
jgi:hypothetical protein